MTVDLWGQERPVRGAMGDHHSHAGGTDEWLTPPDLLAALGPFDLDPCAPIKRPWDTAAKHYTIEDDGLRQEWAGRVWLNPPYFHADKWMHRLAQHGRGIALLFARTETALWHEHVWPHADGLVFLRGRLHFHFPNGARAKANAGAPSALIAYGHQEAADLACADIPGIYVEVR